MTPDFTTSERKTINLLRKLRSRPSTPGRRRAIRARKAKLQWYRARIRAEATATGWNRKDRRRRYHGLIDVYNNDPVGTTYNRVYPKPKPKPSRAWGGSRAVTDEIIRIVAGRAGVTSRKRWWGNRGSDHHMSQLKADAVDFGIANAHWLKNEISRRLGGPAQVGDYAFFNITFDGQRFRCQFIAGTHGTGPHLHCGVRAV